MLAPTGNVKCFRRGRRLCTSFGRPRRPADNVDLPPLPKGGVAERSEVGGIFPQIRCALFAVSAAGIRPPIAAQSVASRSHFHQKEKAHAPIVLLVPRSIASAAYAKNMPPACFLNAAGIRPPIAAQSVASRSHFHQKEKAHLSVCFSFWWE